MPKISHYRYAGRKPVSLKEIPTKHTDGFGKKSEGKEHLQKNITRMMELQDKLYAEDKQSLLIILQAMDAAGKDGTIKHVMEGLNPQGTEVYSFKQPSSEELDHDYLWRVHNRTPERGRIGIFNRSYYEDVLVVRVHNLAKPLMGSEKANEAEFWKQRYRQIRDFERHLTENGTTIVKFFLHLSKEEQKQRFLDRIDDPAKNWKFSESDIREREYWDDYQRCYEEAIQETGTKRAPWYVIPADKKWFSRALISEILVQTLEAMNPAYPSLSKKQLQQLGTCKERLLGEDGSKSTEAGNDQ